MSETQAATNEPAFRKFTPRVERGIKYAIAALRFDGNHNLINPNGGGPLPGAVDADDLLAAAEWLQAQVIKRGAAS